MSWLVCGICFNSKVIAANTAPSIHSWSLESSKESPVTDVCSSVKNLVVLCNTILLGMWNDIEKELQGGLSTGR